MFSKYQGGFSPKKESIMCSSANITTCLNLTSCNQQFYSILLNHCCQLKEFCWSQTIFSWKSKDKWTRNAHSGKSPRAHDSTDCHHIPGNLHSEYPKIGQLELMALWSKDNFSTKFNDKLTHFYLFLTVQLCLKFIFPFSLLGGSILWYIETYSNC